MSQKLDDRERLESYLRQSNVAAKYLLSLVNDILDMSRLQAKELTLDPQPTDLPLLFETVSSIAESAMAGQGLTFHRSVQLTCPSVLADEVRIQQVLLNLLDNARKFTPEGGSVTLSVRQENAGGKIRTVVSVADTGRGMSEAFQKRIFEVFTQELDTVSKGNQGTGLGLPISWRLARLMDGNLTCTSSKGAGSVFTFTFTALPAALPEKAAEPAPAVRQPRVLIAEDNELNGEILLDLLEEKGYEADLAENGKKAVEIFSASAPGTYGLVLMDLLMPEMDGFEAAAAIRALDRSDAAVRIFACTANSSEADREKAFAAGMDAFIPKPVDIDDLLRQING